jgi:hypothetical protein
METGDFGPLLEVLVACIGAIDVIALLAYILDRKRNTQVENYLDENNNVTKNRLSVDSNNNWKPKSGLSTPREKSPPKSTTRPTTPIPLVRIEPDGAAEENSTQLSGDVIENLSEKIFELERKIIDLEVRERSREVSMERYLEVERFRRSKSPSRSSSRDSVPRTFSPPDFDDDSDELSSTGGSLRRILSRDDELRRSIRINNGSICSHGSSRVEELEELTKMEEAEQQNMEDFVPIEYTEDDISYPTSPTRGRPFAFSPIQEAMCPIHGNMEFEPSPEPDLARQVELPWGDVKRDQVIIEEKRKSMVRSMSIEEEPQKEETGDTFDPIKKFIENERSNENSNEIKEIEESIDDSSKSGNKEEVLDLVPINNTEDESENQEEIGNDEINKEKEEPVEIVEEKPDIDIEEKKQIDDTNLLAKLDQVESTLETKANKIQDFLSAERGVLVKEEPVTAIEISKISAIQESENNLKPVEEPLIVPKKAVELSTESFKTLAPLAKPEEVYY